MNFKTLACIKIPIEADIPSQHPKL